ncbi:hypothetical protein IDM40_04730 [Nocardiopsis sp. HNM0947]|uniref:Uncharacterized protein n=1 Tax=Nocardiopsis coralli TaxID=2772213 RepID=A0ABR9P2E0_9ACTN|nr:hypothetical protein [Nocardiopsis coralli]MBE2998016.1 hypothetical protein [Nocardiopsis coralli]
MRNVLQGLGAYLAVAGVSGAVDHLWTQPVLGLFLNWFNRSGPVWWAPSVASTNYCAEGVR